jgi:hypothetical protein
MKRVLLLVEGQTEFDFVNIVLKPHFETHAIFIQQTIINTKREKKGKNFKGGAVSFGKVHTDLKNLLHDTDARLITTMFDFYRLPTDFPGYMDAKGTPAQKVQHLEVALQEAIPDPRFLPYLSTYEFEALLFSDVEKISILHPEATLTGLDKFRHPEEINDQNPPSKRLEDAIPRYQKTLDGPLIADEIGLNTIRAHCPHFNDWISKIEALKDDD